MVENRKYCLVSHFYALLNRHYNNKLRQRPCFALDQKTKAKSRIKFAHVQIKEKIMFKKILIPIDPHNLENAGFSIKLAKKLITKNGTISVLSIIENVPEYIIAELPGRFIDEAKN